MKKILMRWGIPVVGILAFILFVIHVNSGEKIELVSRKGQSFEKAVVTEILQDNIQFDGTRVGEQYVRVKMLTGEKKGEILETTSASGYLFGAGCRVGMHVIIMQSLAGDSVVSSVYAQDREYVIYVFGLLYLALLVIVGGKQGLKGALGLIFTFFSILVVYLPMLYRGYSPFWSAVFICVITTIVTMYLIGGPTRKTAVAVLGTTAGVIIAGISATVFSYASGITGWNVSDIETLLTLWEVNEIHVGGLLFSGLLISSLGAVMDVAMSVSSAIGEIYQQNPALSKKELFKAGMHVGRDMMGTDSNTLILAFAGGSVSMLLLNYAYDLPFLQIINSNNIGIAIMQGLSGSFGIVLSVPVTVVLAVLFYTYQGEKEAA